MKTVSGLLLLALVSTTWGQNPTDVHNENNFAAINETSFKYYSTGVDKGIINPEKYPFESFLRDERNIFQELYTIYTALNDTQPINYEQWLIMNNFGVLPDTQDSIFQRKLSKRSTEDNKRRFVNTVRKGDILITNSGGSLTGLLGHAAIMTTDYYVLEMPGGKGFATGIKDNNRQISKHKWFDLHKHDWTTVYRCKNAAAAKDAAVWADHTYYNPKGGATKTKHITYMITPNIWSTNPSYCSKLVVQSFYYGTGKRNVINTQLLQTTRLIAPTSIPNYFTSNYKLINKGKY